MSIMGKPVWAVVCGAIRQDFEFYSTLAMLCEYRSKGMLDGIVISTWKGQPDNLPGLRGKLKRLNINVQELDQPDAFLDKYAHIGFSVQGFQLRVGLDFVPDDVFVLRCRTDFSEQDIKLSYDLLAGNVDLTLGKHGQMYSGLHYKIAVGRFTVARIFWFTDRCFLGYKADLYKMVNMKISMLEFGMRFCPDMAFFFNVFASEYPIFGEMEKLARKSSVLFENNNLMTKRLREYFEGGEGNREEFALPTLLNKVFGLYFIVMYNCFYEITQQKKTVEELDIYDVFLGNKEGGMTRESTCEAVIRDPEIIRRIINGECKQTEGYRKLYREICSMATPGYAEKMRITQADYEEYAAWVRDVLKLDPSKVLSWSFPKVDRMENVHFEEALEILFEEREYKSIRKFHEVMYDICFTKKRSYYPAIVDNLERLKKVDGDLYEAAMAASVRTDWPFVLQYVAKSLYFNQVSQARVDSYKFIFDNNVGNDHFFKLPMAAGILCTNYYYGKYAEEHGDSKYAQKFYTFVLKEYGQKEKPVDGLYSEAALRAIKEYANAHFTELDSNTSASNAVIFLLDEFGKDALSPEAAEYLEQFAAERKHALPFKMGQPDAYEQLMSGARKALGKREARTVFNLLLREWPRQPERIRTDALKVMREVKDRFFIEDSCLLRAASLGEKEALELRTDEIASDKDFVTLLDVLVKKNRLAGEYDALLCLCKGNLFRTFALEVFSRLEKDPDVLFFSKKDSPAGLELWLGYKKFLDTELDKQLLPVHNNEWIPWSYGENAAPSRFAGFLCYEAKVNKMLYSIEFATDSYKEKERLLKLVGQDDSLRYDPAARIVRLQKKLLPAKNPNELRKDIDTALSDFHMIGDKLVASAENAAELPLFEAPFREEELSSWKRIAKWLHI